MTEQSPPPVPLDERPDVSVDEWRSILKTRAQAFDDLSTANSRVGALEKRYEAVVGALEGFFADPHDLLGTCMDIRGGPRKDGRPCGTCDAARTALAALAPEGKE